MSEEVAALRSMHIDVLKSVGDLCTKLAVLDKLVESNNESFREMKDILHEQGSRLHTLEKEQAANAYFIELIRSINKWVIVAALSACGALAAAFYAVMSGS